jgi:DNA-binding transcriptional LysR family regulator
MDPQRLDLNLLKVLGALLEERSVARAAERLCVSPSAVSHALARLRHAFGDPLFVRSGSAMVPTSRAEGMERPIALLLGSLRANLADAADGEAFDPDRTVRTLRVVSPGALELTLVPALAAALREAAPGWTLAVESFERRSYAADLASGRVDFVFAVGGHTPASEAVGSATLWEDELVVVAGPRSAVFGHTRPLTAEEYLEQPQVYPLPWSLSQNYLDVELGRTGRHRRLLLHLPGYAGVGAVLQRSDLIASMPDRTAAALVGLWPGLRILHLAPARRSPLALLWSLGGQREPALRWARALVEVAAQEVEAAPRVIVGG